MSKNPKTRLTDLCEKGGWELRLGTDAEAAQMNYENGWDNMHTSTYIYFSIFWHKDLTHRGTHTLCLFIIPQAFDQQLTPKTPQKKKKIVKICGATFRPRTTASRIQMPSNLVAWCIVWSLGLSTHTVAHIYTYIWYLYRGEKVVQLYDPRVVQQHRENRLHEIVITISDQRKPGASRWFYFFYSHKQPNEPNKCYL